VIFVRPACAAAATAATEVAGWHTASLAAPAVDAYAHSIAAATTHARAPLTGSSNLTRGTIPPNRAPV